MAEPASNIEPKDLSKPPAEPIIDAEINWAEDQAVVEPEKQASDNDEEKQIAEAKKIIQEVGADFQRGLDTDNSTEDDPQAIKDFEKNQATKQDVKKSEDFLQVGLNETQRNQQSQEEDIKDILASDPGMVGSARVTKEDLILPEALLTHEKYSQFDQEQGKFSYRLKKVFTGVKKRLYKMFTTEVNSGDLLAKNILKIASPYMQPKFADKFEKRVQTLAAEMYPDTDPGKIFDFAKFARIKMEKNSGKLSKKELLILKNTILGKK